RLVLHLFVWRRDAGAGFGTFILRLAFAALVGWVVGAAVCYFAIGGSGVTPLEALSAAVLRGPWNVATLLFSIAVFSLSYGILPARNGSERAAAATASTFEPVGELLKIGLLVVAIALPFLPWSDRYIVDLGILILTYIMLGWGLNVVVGLAGLL